MEFKFTAENFEREVLKSDKPVLVDFWASWCGPCKMLAPVISAIAEDMGDKIKVGKVNVDEEPYLAEKYNITSIPAVFVFKNGNAETYAVGYKTKEELVKELGLQV